MNRRKLVGLLRKSIRESELERREKLQLHIGLCFPGMRDAVLDHVEDELGSASTQADGEIIKIIIEHLPQILQFIQALMKLFS